MKTRLSPRFFPRIVTRAKVFRVLADILKNMAADGSENSFSILVRRTLEDLACIRHSLLAISEESVPEDASKTLDLELAAELKSVVDALRLLLWAYIKALSVKSGRGAPEVLNWYKMELAVEMLRSVRTKTPVVPGTIADFEQLVNQTLASVTPKDRIQ